MIALRLLSSLTTRDSSTHRTLDVYGQSDLGHHRVLCIVVKRTSTAAAAAAAGERYLPTNRTTSHAKKWLYMPPARMSTVGVKTFDNRLMVHLHHLAAAVSAGGCLDYIMTRTGVGL